MSLTRTTDRLVLPGTLQTQLHRFRRRVWAVKMAEAVLAALFGVAVAFLAMYGLDRVLDPPQWSRVALFAVVAAFISLVPLTAYRWIWRNRKLDQLARLLMRKHPHIGDQLLGIIELVRSDSEQQRSRRLCAAAIAQVAASAQDRDFRDSVPNPRPWHWASLAVLPCTGAIALFVLYPAAAGNAASRVLNPWSRNPRYTFAAIAPIPDPLIVAHGEPFTLKVALERSTAWRPESGRVQVGAQEPVREKRRDDAYAFDLPPQVEPATVDLQIGDVRRRIRLEPMLRPELTSLVARAALPGYLHRPVPIQKDARGGSLALVKGSAVRVVATASRTLASARVDGKERARAGAAFASPVMNLAASRSLEFRWRDAFGLEGKEPFTLAIQGREDDAPSISCEGLARRRVVLDTEPLHFQVRAQDDFGVKRIGMEWQGVEKSLDETPTRGERILGAGGPENETLELVGNFSARSLNVGPQELHVRLFAEDYLPGRPRVYSPTCTFFVLDAEQHAIWLTQQLEKWHRQSLEVRDREMQLFETNTQLRLLAADELDQPDTRRKIDAQATAERANGRQLSGLVTGGEDLVRQAMRNPEFGVGHLEKWAEMLQILKDISANRMPSVADLLKDAARAPTQMAETPRKQGPMAGQVRDSRAGSSTSGAENKRTPPSIPTVADRESSQQPPDKTPREPSKSKGSAPSLRLPVTTIAGKGGVPRPAPAASKVEEAVIAQKDLLAEFDKVADELNKVLANLEGSTLVKRLKAESRAQYTIADQLSRQVPGAFGVLPARQGGKPRDAIGALSQQEAKASQALSNIMDDMQAYFERRKLANFKSVLDDMRTQDVIGGLRQLGDDLAKESGVSIAQCEFWSDTLDRWADNLVDPSNCGACPGAKSKDSLPPSIVLEVLQILEGEVNLREETRVAEQAKEAVTSDEHAKGAFVLANVQAVLSDRTKAVGARILELPDARAQFAKELQLMSQVAGVMDEAAGILAGAETGNPAIAAETEAIELLLKSKRINPKGGGGGGGADPGGGSGGPGNDSALALIGGGVNDKEVREDHGVAGATGTSGPSLPEEFRAGLDEYFNRLEGRSGGR